MAHFRGIISKQSGSQASRLGTKASGLTATLDGWTVGVKVRIWHDSQTGEDVVTVARTSGSNDDGTEEIMATWRAPA